MRTAPLLRGSAAAAIAAALAYAIAAWGFGRLYWLAALIPSAAFFFLLVAWFLHLRSDGFFASPRRNAADAALDAGSTGQAPRGGGEAGVPLDIFAPRDSLVARSPEAPSPRKSDPGAARDTSLAFLVAAIELAALAAALYAFAGIGASYFL